MLTFNIKYVNFVPCTNLITVAHCTDLITVLWSCAELYTILTLTARSNLKCTCYCYLYCSIIPKIYFLRRLSTPQAKKIEILALFFHVAKFLLKWDCSILKFSWKFQKCAVVVITSHFVCTMGGLTPSLADVWRTHYLLTR